MKLKPFFILHPSFCILGSWSFRRPPALANDTDDQPILVLANQVSIDDDGWCLIAPYGEWPKTRVYREDGRVKSQQYIQVLDNAAADALVSKENSLFGRLKRAFVGITVYKGHGDLNDIDPAALGGGEGKIKLGVIDRVRKTDRGVEAHFNLDNDGAEAVRAGWKYPSGFWYVTPLAANPRGGDVSSPKAQTKGNRGQAVPAPSESPAIRCQPTKLISVALTPTPNIRGVQSLANAQPQTSAPAEENLSLRDNLIGALLMRGAALPVNPDTETIVRAVAALGVKMDHDHGV